MKRTVFRWRWWSALQLLHLFSHFLLLLSPSFLGTHTQNDIHYHTHPSYITTSSTTFKGRLRNHISLTLVCNSTVTSHPATITGNTMTCCFILFLQEIFCAEVQQTLIQDESNRWHKSSYQPTFCRATFNSHSVVKNSSSDRAGIYSQIIEAINIGFITTIKYENSWYIVHKYKHWAN